MDGRGQPAVGDVGALAQEPGELGDPGAQGRDPVSGAAPIAVRRRARQPSSRPACPPAPAAPATPCVARRRPVLRRSAACGRPSRCPTRSRRARRRRDRVRSRWRAGPRPLPARHPCRHRSPRRPARQSPNKPSLRPFARENAPGDVDPAERVRPRGPAGHRQGGGVRARGERACGVAGHRRAAPLPRRPAAHAQRERHGADRGRGAAVDDRRADGVARAPRPSRRSARHAGPRTGCGWWRPARSSSS